MSIPKQKIWSTILKPEEEALVKRFVKESGVAESVILRGLIRMSMKQKKLDLLKLIRIGSY